MKLIIPYVDSQFNEYLINEMFVFLSENLNRDRLIMAQEFVELEQSMKSIYRPNIDLYQICLSSPYNLKINRYLQHTEFVFDNNSLIYATTIRVVDIINLVNYGNGVVRPYPIFDEMFDYFNTHIDNIYNNYLFSIGG